MTKHRKINDSTIYDIYLKLYSFYDVDKYLTIKDFVDELSNLNYSAESNTNVIISSLLKRVYKTDVFDYLINLDFTNHSILLIMSSIDNFLYLLEHPEKSFYDVFGTKSQFHLISVMVDVIAAKEIEKLK